MIVGREFRDRTPAAARAEPMLGGRTDRAPAREADAEYRFDAHRPDEVGVGGDELLLAVHGPDPRRLADQLAWGSH